MKLNSETVFITTVAIVFMIAYPPWVSVRTQSPSVGPNSLTITISQPYEVPCGYHWLWETFPGDKIDTTRLALQVLAVLLVGAWFCYAITPPVKVAP